MNFQIIARSKYHKNIKNLLIITSKVIFTPASAQLTEDIVVLIIIIKNVDTEPRTEQFSLGKMKKTKKIHINIHNRLTLRYIIFMAI